MLCYLKNMKDYNSDSMSYWKITEMLPWFCAGGGSVTLNKPQTTSSSSQPKTFSLFIHNDTNIFYNGMKLQNLKKTQ